MVNFKEKAGTSNILFVLAFSMMFSSCIQKKCDFHHGFSSQRLSTQKIALIGTAKEYVIPIPLGFRCTDTKKTSYQSQYITHYEGTLPLEKVIHFYQQEMEQRGGIFSDFVHKTEAVFYSNNPTDEYTCYVKKHNNKTFITCFYKTKKEVNTPEFKDLNTKKDFLH